jgi:lipoic acid synthetase
LDKKPSWIKKKISLDNSNISEVKRLIGSSHLHTVCQSAKCPNIFECFSRKTSTFMLMGDMCTRNCAFCGVDSGKPGPLDKDEPEKIARAVKEIGLKYVVITSVTRDDLDDGGASQFLSTVNAIKKIDPGVKVECLIPDLGGDYKSLEKLLKGDLDVLNHNMETVRQNYDKARQQADYDRSLIVLSRAKKLSPDIYTKSGFMLGLGETRQQVTQLLKDLKKNKVDIITIGQYLQPSPDNIKVSKYYKPEEFEEIKKEAVALGFMDVEAGPFVRSSYCAEAVLNRALKQKG